MTGETMRKKRKALGLSQPELAEKISETVLKGIRGPIAESTIQEMEKGRRAVQPYVETFFKIYG